MSPLLHIYTSDPTALANYYMKVLGFRMADRHPIQGALEWCSLHLGSAEVALSEHPDNLRKLETKTSTNLGKVLRERTQPGPVVYEVFVPNLQSYYEEVMSRGADLLGKPEALPWGVRQFAVRDPDGNLMSFWEPRAQKLDSQSK